MSHAGRALARIAIAGIVAYGVAAALRYGLIERDDIGTACESGASSWTCGLRMLVIQAFVHDVFGIASVVAATLAAWRRSAMLAMFAIAMGVAGMVLYSFAWSVIGMLGGALVLARVQCKWQQHGEAERQH
jgi:hypothetical protein